MLESLGKVAIFEGLSTPQLEQLRNAMVEAPFAKGDFVFEQVRGSEDIGEGNEHGCVWSG